MGLLFTAEQTAASEEPNRFSTGAKNRCNTPAVEQHHPHSNKTPLVCPVRCAGDRPEPGRAHRTSRSPPVLLSCLSDGGFDGEGGSCVEDERQDKAASTAPAAPDGCIRKYFSENRESHFP